MIDPGLDMIAEGHLGGYVRGGDPGTWCPRLWEWLVQCYRIQSVLDVGCGEGHATRFFRELGCDVLGVDGSCQAIRDSVLPTHVVLHDFNEGPFIPDRTFDMIWSCEFLEHVEERYLPHILETFRVARRAIVVTHAMPGQVGYHHVNCRPASYWIRRIEGVGFACGTGVTIAARKVTLRDYPKVNHFGRSGLVFLERTLAHSQGVYPARKAWGPILKGAWIAWSFRLSRDYRQHRRCRRAIKRR